MCPYRTAKFEETASTCGADTIDVTSVDSRGNKAWKQDVCTDTGKLMRRMAVEQRTADKARSRVSLIFAFFALLRGSASCIRAYRIRGDVCTLVSFFLHHKYHHGLCNHVQHENQTLQVNEAAADNLATSAARQSPHAAAAAVVVRDEMADTDSHAAAGISKTKQTRPDAGQYDNSTVEPSPIDVCESPQHDLEKAFIAHNKKKLTLEELRRAFETATKNSLTPQDPVYKRVDRLLSSMTEEIKDFESKDESESDEDLITFKIWDQGGQKVTLLISMVANRLVHI